MKTGFLSKKALAGFTLAFLLAALALLVGCSAQGESASEPTSGIMTVTIDDDGNWTDDSTPVLVKIEDAEDESTQFHVVTPETNSEPFEVEEGSYQVEVFAPLNADGTGFTPATYTTDVAIEIDEECDIDIDMVLDAAAVTEANLDAFEAAWNEAEDAGSDSITEGMVEIVDKNIAACRTVIADAKAKAEAEKKAAEEAAAADAKAKEEAVKSSSSSTKSGSSTSGGGSYSAPAQNNPGNSGANSGSSGSRPSNPGGSGGSYTGGCQHSFPGTLVRSTDPFGDACWKCTVCGLMLY